MSDRDSLRIKRMGIMLYVREELRKTGTADDRPDFAIIACSLYFMDDDVAFDIGIRRGSFFLTQRLHVLTYP
jgi:tmRNA-binding protein